MIEKGKAVETIVSLVDQAEDTDQLDELLHEISYTLGGMVMHFPEKVRSRMIVSLTETMGTAYQKTAKFMGEKCDIEMIVGSGKR